MIQISHRKLLVLPTPRWRWCLHPRASCCIRVDSLKTKPTLMDRFTTQLKLLLSGTDLNYEVTPDGSVLIPAAGRISIQLTLIEPPLLDVAQSVLPVLSSVTEGRMKVEGVTKVAEDTKLGEIIVAARRREENIQQKDREGPCRG
jgi:hypothetical protein